MRLSTGNDFFSGSEWVVFAYLSPDVCTYWGGPSYVNTAQMDESLLFFHIYVYVEVGFSQTIDIRSIVTWLRCSFLFACDRKNSELESAQLNEVSLRLGTGVYIESPDWKL